MLEVETRNADPADVASIDAIITAAYDSISGPPGKRDWNRERSLFIPGACLIPTTENSGETSLVGEIVPHMLDIDGFIERVCDYVEKNGFYEKEIARRTEQLIRSRMSGARTSRVTKRTIPNPSCAGSTAFSCSTIRVVGGS